MFSAELSKIGLVSKLSAVKSSISICISFNTQIKRRTQDCFLSFITLNDDIFVNDHFFFQDTQGGRVR